jgi:hypothetical protein
MVALEREVGIGERELRDYQLQRLRHFCSGANPELRNHLLYLRIVCFRRAQLKRVGLFEEQDVIESHRGFARVVEARRELGTRIVRIRACHSRRQRRCRLCSERVFFFFALVSLPRVFFVRFGFGCVLGGCGGCSLSVKRDARTKPQENHSDRYWKRQS